MYLSGANDAWTANYIQHIKASVVELSYCR